MGALGTQKKKIKKNGTQWTFPVGHQKCPKTLSPTHKLLARCIVAGDDYERACEVSGLSSSRARDLMCTEIFDKYKKELEDRVDTAFVDKMADDPTKAHQYIRSHKMEAAQEMVGVMRQSESIPEKRKAAEFVYLDGQQNEVQQNAQVVINIGNLDEALRDAKEEIEAHAEGAG